MPDIGGQNLDLLVPKARRVTFIDAKSSRYGSYMNTIFSKAISTTCMRTRTGTVSTVLPVVCLMGLRQLYSADRKELLTLYQNINSTSANDLL